MGTSETGGGQESPYILGGNWNLNVQGGNVTDFAANFVMVHPDGTGYHTTTSLTLAQAIILYNLSRVKGFR